MPTRGRVAPTDAPKLSAVLRQFLKRVHPDLFSDADLQTVRASNEKNLSGFNDFLSSLKSRDVDDKLFRGNQHFTFFIRDFRPPIALSDGKAAATADNARSTRAQKFAPSAVPNWARARVACTPVPPKLLKVTLELGSSGAPSKVSSAHRFIAVTFVSEHHWSAACSAFRSMRSANVRAHSGPSDD